MRKTLLISTLLLVIVVLFAAVPASQAEQGGGSYCGCVACGSQCVFRYNPPGMMCRSDGNVPLSAGCYFCIISGCGNDGSCCQGPPIM